MVAEGIETEASTSASPRSAAPHGRGWRFGRAANCGDRDAAAPAAGQEPADAPPSARISAGASWSPRHRAGVFRRPWLQQRRRRRVRRGSGSQARVAAAGSGEPRQQSACAQPGHQFGEPSDRLPRRWRSSPCHAAHPPPGSPVSDGPVAGSAAVRVSGTGHSRSGGSCVPGDRPRRGLIADGSRRAALRPLPGAFAEQVSEGRRRRSTSDGLRPGRSALGAEGFVVASVIGMLLQPMTMAWPVSTSIDEAGDISGRVSATEVRERREHPRC